MSLIRIVAILSWLTPFLSSLNAEEIYPPVHLQDAEPDIFGFNSNFSMHLQQIVASLHPKENVVYSPIALKTMLSMMFGGASGKTAHELRLALGLPHGSKTWVYKVFDRLLKSLHTPETHLQLVNKFYYQKSVKIRSSFRNIAERYFEGAVGRVDFTDRERTASIINDWVANKTNNNVLNIMNPDSIDSNTMAMLVSSIYFQGNWEAPFSVEDTSCSEFFEDDRVTPVETIYQRGLFSYADLSHLLGASVLQIPYADTDLSMLILLPDEDHSLDTVHLLLRDIDLRDLPKWLQKHQVDVYLPKFRITYQLELDEILEKLEILSLFTNKAQLSSIFGKNIVPISGMKHKVFFDVNESGSDIPVATGANEKPKRLIMPYDWIRMFKANRPFIFAVISPEAIYFVGQIVTPQKNCIL